MKRRLMAAGLLVFFIAGAGAVTAHKTYRIIGTITVVSAKRLDVKQTKDGKIISMTMDDDTLVTRDKKEVDVSNLKVGLSVVVDACGDSLKDLVVEEVRIVPALIKK